MTAEETIIINLAFTAPTQDKLRNPRLALQQHPLPKNKIVLTLVSSFS